MEDAKSQFDVNIFGLANLTKQVIPNMRKQGSSHKLNVSSVGSKMYSPYGSWYHATKLTLARMVRLPKNRA
jgi:short-subunit dehydrogenase